jgi:hypothetical protein
MDMDLEMSVNMDINIDLNRDIDLNNLQSFFTDPYGALVTTYIP